jgi:hypothetical protein
LDHLILDFGFWTILDFGKKWRLIFNQTKKEINFQNAWFLAQELDTSTGYNLR